MAGALVGRSCAALTGPTAEGEKGIGKLRVWAKCGLGGLRVGRAIGEHMTWRCYCSVRGALDAVHN